MRRARRACRPIGERRAARRLAATLSDLLAAAVPSLFVAPQGLVAAALLDLLAATYTIPAATQEPARAPDAGPGEPDGAQPDSSRLTIERIFVSHDFDGARLPSVNWLPDGSGYMDVQPDSSGGAALIRVDLESGRRSVAARAGELVDEKGAPLLVEDVSLSDDGSRALLVHDSERVWRFPTAALYSVFDFRTRRVTPVSRRPGLQMFAKLSPDGRRVAFVREGDLVVTDLATGEEQRLTTDGGPDVVNGTGDWVYEEEFDVRDGFRWSPDSRRIAFLHFDDSAVPFYPWVNDTTPGAPTITPIHWPEAGQTNPTVKVGVVDLASGETSWMETGSGPDVYLPRLEWAGPDSLAIQRLPRLQNRVDLLLASAETGVTRTVMTDADSAYVDVMDQPTWIGGGRRFLWRSDRSAWRQVYLYERSGRLLRQITRDGADVLDILGVDERRGDVYCLVAAPDPTQAQIYRHSLDGRRVERVTRGHGYREAALGPRGRYLVEFASSAGTPIRATAYALPSLRPRVLEENAELARRLAALDVRAPEFFRLQVAGDSLDAYRIAPADFDSTTAHPTLLFVYGGPATPSVLDGYDGETYLWHQLLAQHGYVVVSVDNHGAAWRGRDFRKMTYGRLGQLEARDQVEVLRWLAQRSWVDPERIGMWDWSGGATLTLLTAERAGDLLEAAIAVAPVTDDRLYDTIWTERYLGLPDQNPEGYREASPIAHPEGLRARLLLVHGTADDNVHAQNTLLFAHRLVAAGKLFDLNLYPGKRHDISDSGPGDLTQAHLYGTLTRFLLEHL